MAEFRHSITEMMQQAGLFKKSLLAIISGLRATKQEQEAIFARGGTAVEVKAAMVIRLEDLADNLAGLETSIGIFRGTDKSKSWARTFQVGIPKEFHHFSIDVDNGATQAEITFKTIQNNEYLHGGVRTFSTGDLVVISNSSNSNQNGVYIVDAATAGNGTNIILTGVMPGSDNTEEQSMKITFHYEA